MRRCGAAVSQPLSFMTPPVDNLTPRDPSHIASRLHLQAYALALPAHGAHVTRGTSSRRPARSPARRRLAQRGSWRVGF